MRRIIGLLFAFLIGWGAFAQASLPPPPTRWVTDAQAHLSPGTREDLDRRLAAYQKATGHQVLVWIGGSTGGTPLEDWAVRTFESWQVGRKGLDDGLVLFLLAQDRKLRIEVGYGLEGQMPDAIASRIIRETLTPRLAAGDWDGAVQNGVEAILSTLGGETSPPAEQDHAPAQNTLGLGEIIFFSLLGLAFLALLITHPSLAIGLLFSILSGGRGGGSGGGSWSGGGGGWSGGGGRSGGGGASGSW